MVSALYVMKKAQDWEYARSINYHEYIQSDAWKARAEEAKNRAGFRCQLCSVSGFLLPLNAHHNNYKRLGNELDSDITVLCQPCHEKIHAAGIKPGYTPKIEREEFSLILRGLGVTWTNDDPYKYYEYGKQIIQTIVDGFDPDLYDYYNKVNIEILDRALENQDSERFNAAKENDFYPYDSEYDWRANNDYWKGYKK